MTKSLQILESYLRHPERIWAPAANFLKRMKSPHAGYNGCDMSGKALCQIEGVDIQLVPSLFFSFSIIKKSFCSRLSHISIFVIDTTEIGQVDPIQSCFRLLEFVKVYMSNR